MGNSFWEGFADYINKGWSQALALTSILYGVQLGLTVRQLAVARSAATKGVKVSQKGIDKIKKHLTNPYFDADTANDAMIARLENALANGATLKGADANFYLHELKEFEIMSKIGYSDVTYEIAHKAALNYYQVSNFALYHPDVILMNPSAWNKGFFTYWGI